MNLRLRLLPALYARSRLFAFLHVNDRFAVAYPEFKKLFYFGYIYKLAIYMLFYEFRRSFYELL